MAASIGNEFAFAYAFIPQIARPEGYGFLDDHLWPEAMGLAAIFRGENEVPAIQRDDVITMPMLASAKNIGRTDVVQAGPGHHIPVDFVVVEMKDLDKYLPSAEAGVREDGTLTLVVPGDHEARPWTNKIDVTDWNSPRPHTTVWHDTEYLTLEDIRRVFAREVSPQESLRLALIRNVRIDFGTLVTHDEE